MDLVSKLSQIITSSPDIIQFAKDRKFEESWILNIKDGKPDKQTIINYLEKETFQILIVEYVWNSTIDEKRFVLTVFYDSTCALNDPEQFINLCLDNFINYVGLSDLIKSFNTKVIGREHIFNTPIEAINLGIFNYWLSSNPIELWNDKTPYSKAEIIAKLNRRSDLIETKLNFQGLQFRFNLSGQFPGPYYGFKTPCCKKVTDSWVLDLEIIDYWITLMLNIN